MDLRGILYLKPIGFKYILDNFKGREEKMRQVSIALLERQVKARIAKLGQSEPFIMGSLVESKRKCGQKKCACANGGPLHSAWIITKHGAGNKTRSIYVPVAMLAEVRQWTDEYKKVKALLQEIDELGEQIIAATKARKKAGKATAMEGEE